MFLNLSRICVYIPWFFLCWQWRSLEAVSIETVSTSTTPHVHHPFRFPGAVAANYFRYQSQPVLLVRPGVHGTVQQTSTQSLRYSGGSLHKQVAHVRGVRGHSTGTDVLLPGRAQCRVLSQLQLLRLSSQATHGLSMRGRGDGLPGQEQFRLQQVVPGGHQLLHDSGRGTTAGAATREAGKASGDAEQWRARDRESFCCPGEGGANDSENQVRTFLGTTKTSSSYLTRSLPPRLSVTKSRNLSIPNRQRMPRRSCPWKDSTDSRDFSSIRQSRPSSFKRSLPRRPTTFWW